MSTEADDDDMEEVEFISVSHMFQKFKMHYINKLPVCWLTESLLCSTFLCIFVGLHLWYIACIFQEALPELECIDLGSDSEDEGFSSSLTGTVSC